MPFNIFCGSAGICRICVHM